MSWVVYVCLGLGLSAALVGGVFQSFSDFVMRGLMLAEPAGGMESMQQLNRTVFRSVFLMTFLALVPALGALAFYAGTSLGGAPRVLIISAAVVYGLLVFGVTARENVPMNESLDRLSPSSVEGQAYWARYGRSWTRWNHVRTVGSILTATCLLLAAALSAAERSLP